MRRLAPLAAAFALALAEPAAAERLVLSLSTHRVTIGSNYTGAQMVVFGVVERDGQSVARPGGFDVVLTLRGPREALTIRRKEAVGPLWINRGQQKFVTVPSVLLVSSSGPLDGISAPAVRARLRLGVEAIVDGPDFTFDRDGRDDPFRSALIRLKRRDGLWREDDRGVTFVTPDVFRAVLPIPAVAPVGDYQVDAIVLAAGAAVAQTQTAFELVKTGIEEQITYAARDHALAYGLSLAGLSLAFGWLASVIFRRD